MKQSCEKCEQMAVWYYMPSSDELYYCDNCIPRGCSCNINPETGLQDIDERGRLLPCCEYGYDKEGFDGDKSYEEYGE